MKALTGYERGVNLGGWMSHENYEKEHLDSFITEEDIARIASWGLDHVRIPVDYNLFEGECAGFAYLDKAVEWCGRHGLNILLDLHKTAGFSYEAMYNENGFFDDEAYQQRFYTLWEGFARRYAHVTHRMAFELLNELTEPSYMPAWNRIASEAIGRIRAIAPTVWILVGSYYNNSVEALPALELPQDDYLVYNFHCYDPILFTHQAAYWVPQMPADFRIDYPVDGDTYHREFQRVFSDGRWQDMLEISSLDAEFFKKRFEKAVRLAEEKNVALYCGEYGVIENAADEAVLRWYRDIHEAFTHFGIGRAAWNYKEMNFGILQRTNVQEQLIALL